MSDEEGEDDDVCVWEDGPDLSDYDNIDECLNRHVRKVGVSPKRKLKLVNDYLDSLKINEETEIPEKTSEQGETEQPQTAPETTLPKTTEEIGLRVADIPISDIDPKTGKLTPEAFRAREVQYALSTARRSLTHASQFLLKLEARTGRATKEGIRQTLDATVDDMHYDFDACGSDGGPPDADHKSEIDEIKHLSNDLYNRVYLLDRHFRRLAQPTRDAGAGTKILSEPDVREWVKVELATNHLAAEEACFYTAQELAWGGRGFSDWVAYLKTHCGFGDHPHDEAKLVELAWRFLDRNLRGPRPPNPTSVERFVGGLDAMRGGDVWAGVLENPRKQEVDDVEAWKLLRRYWSSRTAPS
ncbi:hypothetical protein F5X98DRAFT_363500 [Xylaria grammica]|nr:hypothetical protein F5X98DRAFT_363500 [Xylaria grammica]